MVYIFSSHFGIPVSNDHIEMALKNLENLGIVNVVVDPYADTVIETSDEEIIKFLSQSDNKILKRSWDNEDWLKSAYNNQNLWSDLSHLISDINSIESIPTSDGFVTVNHNSAEFIETERAIVTAEEAVRGDNEFDGEQRGWIRVHLEAGVALLKQSGPIIRGALVALIVEPLKAAMKATANENVKKLIGVALTAFLKWLGL
jgi:hypothetical protein